MGKGRSTLMIIFKEKKINKDKICLFAKNICLETIKSMSDENKYAYYSHFQNTNINKLHIELARISNVKDFEIDDLYFYDKQTEFKIIVTLFIFKYDDDNCRELMAIYDLELNQEFKVIDDSFKKL